MTTQRILALSQEEAEALDQELDEHRSQVIRFLPDHELEGYGDRLFKLDLLQNLLEAGPRDLDTLIGMGAVFGDAFADLGFQWVLVEEEEGRQPALFSPWTRRLLFPLGMFASRVKAGEEFSVHDLFWEQVERLRQDSPNTRSNL